MTHAGLRAWALLLPSASKIKAMWWMNPSGICMYKAPGHVSV